MARRHLRPSGRVPAHVRRYNARLASIVRRYGWQITYVGGGKCADGGCRCPAGRGKGPPFAYTVGLTDFDHPELLVFGMSAAEAMEVLNGLGEAIREGRRFVDGQVLPADEWGHPMMFEEVPNPGEIVFLANEYYRKRRPDSVAVLQVTYADHYGRFPWEEGYPTPELQPRPGTFRA